MTVIILTLFVIAVAYCVCTAPVMPEYEQKTFAVFDERFYYPSCVYYLAYMKTQECEVLAFKKDEIILIKTNFNERGKKITDTCRN